MIRDIYIKGVAAGGGGGGVTRSTATLIKTGQTTSFRTGDDGDLEAGRDTDFLTLDAAPLHDDGSATLNTTTNRFTDSLGGQTYSNDLVLDWSTWNGATLLVYVKTTQVNATWDASIDAALAFSVGSFSIFRVINIKETLNLLNHSLNFRFNYSPFNINIVSAITTSTTVENNTTSIWRVHTSATNYVTSVIKATVNRTFYVRTFALSSSNILS